MPLRDSCGGKNLSFFVLLGARDPVRCGRIISLNRVHGTASSDPEPPNPVIRAVALNSNLKCLTMLKGEISGLATKLEEITFESIKSS